MNQELINSVFTPIINKHETKADVTTRVAREIMDQEAAARAAKTERLRAARLAREAAEASMPAAPAARKTARSSPRKAAK